MTCRRAQNNQWKRVALLIMDEAKQLSQNGRTPDEAPRAVLNEMHVESALVLQI
jgi:hypothetical protein